MDSHFWAGAIRPFFWLLVLIPALAGLRWALNRFVRPRLKSSSWDYTQKPVGDVGAAVVILLGVVVAGLLVT